MFNNSEKRFCGSVNVPIEFAEDVGKTGAGGAAGAAGGTGAAGTGGAAGGAGAEDIAGGGGAKKHKHRFEKQVKTVKKAMVVFKMLFTLGYIRYWWCSGRSSRSNWNRLSWWRSWSSRSRTRTWSSRNRWSLRYCWRWRITTIFPMTTSG